MFCAATKERVREVKFGITAWSASDLARVAGEQVAKVAKSEYDAIRIVQEKTHQG